MSAKSVWHFRAVVVRDKPKAFRPWRWGIERAHYPESLPWEFIKEGRAFTLGGALRKATRRGITCAWDTERVELRFAEISPSSEVRTERRRSAPTELQPEFLP